jgi:hypothetical protein
MARCRLTHSGEKTRRLREQHHGFAVGRHRSHGRYEEVELPIIGVGRIATVEDASSSCLPERMPYRSEPLYVGILEYSSRSYRVFKTTS